MMGSMNNPRWKLMSSFEGVYFSNEIYEPTIFYDGESYLGTYNVKIISNIIADKLISVLRCNRVLTVNSFASFEIPPCTSGFFVEFLWIGFCLISAMVIRKPNGYQPFARLSFKYTLNEILYCMAFNPFCRMLFVHPVLVPLIHIYPITSVALIVRYQLWHYRMVHDSNQIGTASLNRLSTIHHAELWELIHLCDHVWWIVHFSRCNSFGRSHCSHKEMQHEKPWTQSMSATI